MTSSATFSTVARMVKMLKDLVKPPLIHPDILEEVEGMDKQNPLLERIFSFWKTWLVKDDESILKVPVFKGFQNLNVELRGSFGENVDIPEYFIYEKDGDSSSFSSGGEIDCTATIEDFQVSEGSDGNFIAEYIEGHPGFAKLRIDRTDDIDYWIHYSEIVSDIEGKNKILYLLPEGFREECYFMLLVKNTMATFELEVNKQLGKMSSLNSIFILTVQEGPAIKTTFILKIGERYQVDTAIALKCSTWPIIATNWVTRKRESNWPSDTLIKRCVKDGCCFVPKSIEDSTTNTEWRVSFVEAESTVMKSLTRIQKSCYRIFKAIWRVGFRLPAEKYVQSYHIKTIFLWYCEKVKSEQFSKELIVSRIFELLHYLRKCLIEKNCPQYFIPESNLFASINNKVIAKTLEHVNIAISKANDIWIYNRGLFMLPFSTLTRIGMSREATKSFLDSLDKLVVGLVSEEIGLIKDKSNIKVNIRNSDENSIPWIGVGETQSLSNGNVIVNTGNVDDDAVVPKCDIESDVGSESSDDYDNGTDNDGASDKLEETMEHHLLNIGMIYIDIYCQNADIDNDDLMYLNALLMQIISNARCLTENVLYYFGQQIAPKQIMQMERYSKGLWLSFAELLSYFGSCGLLLRYLAKFRKKGSTNYDSKDTT